MAQKTAHVKPHTRKTKRGVTYVKEYTKTVDAKDALLHKNKVVERYNLNQRKADLLLYKKKIEKLPKEKSKEMLDFFFGEEHKPIAPAVLSFNGKKVQVKEAPTNDILLKVMFNSKWKTLKIKDEDGNVKEIKRPDLTPMEWQELIRQNSWVINSVVARIKSQFPIDKDLVLSMKSAGLKGIIEAIDHYGEKHDAKNPENLSRTIWSQVSGRVREAFTKERTALTSSISLPYQKMKHYNNFNRLFMQTLGEPNQVEILHEKMGLKKKDLYHDLRNSPEGEEALPLEGYTSAKKKEVVLKKIQARDERLKKEEESYKGQIEILKQRLKGEVTEEDRKIVNIGVKSIDENISSMQTLLDTMKKNKRGSGKEFAQLRHEMGLLKQAKKKLEGSITPIDLDAHRKELESLNESHAKRMNLINEIHNEEIERSNIGGFRDFYDFMTGLMGGYRPYELDKFVDEEEGEDKLEEILNVGSDPSPENQVALREQHEMNIANFKTYLNFLPDFPKKVIQLHLGIDQHSPLTKEGGVGTPMKRQIWGEPLASGKQITEHMNQLIKDKLIPASIFGREEGGDDFEVRLRSWKAKKPEPMKLVKRDKNEFKKEIRDYQKRRLNARKEIAKELGKGNFSQKQKDAIRERIYDKHKANDKNVEHQPRVKAYVKKTPKELKEETARWIANKPRREMQGSSREVMVNEQLKIAKKLMASTVPAKVVEDLIRTHRAIQSFKVTKANLKDELMKSIAFQAFFDAFNDNSNFVDKETGVAKNMGFKFEYYTTSRGGAKSKKVYYPTVDELITNVSLVPDKFVVKSVSQQLEDFLNKKNFPKEKTDLVHKAIEDWKLGKLNEVFKETKEVIKYALKQLK